MLVRVRSANFDGTTVAPTSAVLVQSGEENVYSLFAQLPSVPIDPVGFLPLSLFADALGSRLARIACVFHDGASAVDEARMSVGYDDGGTIRQLAAPRVWNPQIQGVTNGLVIPNKDWGIVLSSNRAGVQEFFFELLPIDEDTAYAEFVANSQFDLSSTPAQLVAGTFTAVQTAAYDAGAGQVVLYDTSGGAFTVTLPASPQTNDVIGFVEAANSAVNALTIDGNGNNVQDQTAGTLGATATYQVASGNLYYRFDGTQWWIVGVRD